MHDNQEVKNLSKTTVKQNFYCTDCNEWAPDCLITPQEKEKDRQYDRWYEGWCWVIKHSGHKVEQRPLPLKENL
jgi:hypothetical protein